VLADQRSFHDAGTVTYGLLTSLTLLPRDLRQKCAFAWATSGLLVARTDRKSLPARKHLAEKKKTFAEKKKK
jgi:hypothetical protein